MLHNRLKALRKSKKMTQDELAAALGTSKQTIHRYENGIITMSIFDFLLDIDSLEY